MCDHNTDVTIEIGAEFDAMGEHVEITNEMDGKVCVLHHDREPVGDSLSYTVWRPRESVEAVAAREDWERLDVDEDDDEVPERMPGEWISTPRCPICSRFMSRDFDGAGLPAAQCSRTGCHGMLDISELIERGHFEEGREVSA